MFSPQLHRLTGVDVSNILGPNQVEGTSFRSDYPGAVQLAQAKRTDSVRIACSPDGLGRGQHQRKSPGYPPEHFFDRVSHLLVARTGQQVQHDLAVGRGPEDGSLPLEFCTDLFGL